MKLKASHETETFVNARGNYVIEQKGGIVGDQSVELTPEQMRLLIADMQLQLKSSVLVCEDR
ncbi:MAG: hypothetical protein ACRCTL_10975 [Pseudomonas sp.]